MAKQKNHSGIYQLDNCSLQKHRRTILKAEGIKIYSHLDQVIESPMKELNLIPLYLPPNSTHLFCILDLAIKSTL